MILPSLPCFQVENIFEPIKIKVNLRNSKFQNFRNFSNYRNHRPFWVKIFDLISRFFISDLTMVITIWSRVNFVRLWNDAHTEHSQSLHSTHLCDASFLVSLSHVSQSISCCSGVSVNRLKYRESNFDRPLNLKSYLRWYSRVKCH